MGITNEVKVGDYVSYKLAGYYPKRHGTVTALQTVRCPSHINDAGKQAKVLWCNIHKPIGTVWEWCDHLKVLATTETK